MLKNVKKQAKNDTFKTVDTLSPTKASPTSKTPLEADKAIEGLTPFPLNLTATEDFEQPTRKTS